MRSSKQAPRPLSAAMAFIAIASLTTIASAQSGSRSYGGGSSSQYRGSAPQSAGSSSRSSGSTTRSNGSATQTRGSAAKVSAAEQQRQKQLLQQHLDEQQAQQEARQTKARAKQSQQKKALAERRLKQFQQVAADRGAKLALEGYCPVCVIDHQEWVAGDPKHSATYDGTMYFFPSDEPRRIFVSNPAKYVPALGGDCIVCYENGGKRVPGNVRRASLHQGRLFLFPGEDERAAFKQAPHEFENTDLAADGNCIVCKVKTNETVKGSERFTAVNDGFRYLFPSDSQRQLFLESPQEFITAAAKPMMKDAMEDDMLHDPGAQEGKKIELDTSMIKDENMMKTNTSLKRSETDAMEKS